MTARAEQAIRMGFERQDEAAQIAAFCERNGLQIPSRPDELEEFFNIVADLGIDVSSRDGRTDVSVSSEDPYEIYGGGSSILQCTLRNEWDREPILVQAQEVRVAANDEVVGEVLVPTRDGEKWGYNQAGEVRLSEDGQYYIFFDERTGVVGRRPEPGYTIQPTKMGKDYRGLVPVIDSNQVGKLFDGTQTQHSFEAAQGRADRTRRGLPQLVIFGK